MSCRSSGIRLLAKPRPSSVSRASHYCPPLLVNGLDPLLVYSTLYSVEQSRRTSFGAHNSPGREEGCSCNECDLRHKYWQNLTLTFQRQKTLRGRGRRDRERGDEKIEDNLSQRSHALVSEWVNE